MSTELRSDLLLLAFVLVVVSLLSLGCTRKGPAYQQSDNYVTVCIHGYEYYEHRRLTQLAIKIVNESTVKCKGRRYEH
jgi:hypothetical protein